MTCDDYHALRAAGPILDPARYQAAIEHLQACDECREFTVSHIRGESGACGACGACEAWVDDPVVAAVKRAE